MKSFFRIFLAAALSAGILNGAQAQRTRSSRGSNSPSRNSSPVVRSSPSVRSSAPTRSMSRREAPQRATTSTRNYNNNNIARRESRPVVRTAQRNPSPGNSVRRSIDSRGNYAMRGGRSYNPRYNNGYRYSNYRYRPNYYGNVYGRRTAFMYGPRYRIIPHSFISIHFGGHPYYCNNGFYYGYYGGYYEPIFPPFGLRIAILPFGYSSFYMGEIPFYYYNGIYYRSFDDNNTYEVVDAPMGATVSSLPDGAKSVVINGEDLYELNGTYYKADKDSNGNDVFVVVGKNGVINNSTDMQNDPAAIQDATQTPSGLQIGDKLAQLPEGSKIVTINGQQMYETPDNVYLQQETSNGVVQYKVVGN